MTREMTYIGIMSTVNVFEVKAKFAEYLDRVARGERIVIYRYNKPVAELRPVEAARTGARPVGPVEGRPTFEIAPSFFDPLDDEELKAWEGLSAVSDPVGHTFPPHFPDTSAKVAETAPVEAPEQRRTKRRLS